MNTPIDISQTVLRSKRLILRPWQQSDLNDLYAYASVDDVGQMAGWKPHETIDESQVILKLFIEEKKTFALVFNGRVIGSLGIEKYNEEDFPELRDRQCREIGYVLSKDYWGQGLMPEAVNEVIRFLFEEVGLDVILCRRFLFNWQSARVQEKCGFRHYAYGRFETALGTVEEDEITILTREQWMSEVAGVTVSEYENSMDNKEMSEVVDLKLQTRLRERFFRYVAVESQSLEGVDEVPSTPGQWTLARLLMCDLEALGLEAIAINDHCVVQAHLPARLYGSRKNVPSIGFVCHLDTVDVGLAPDIHPVLIRNYQGGDICQNPEKQLYISVEEHPELMDYIGEDIIVSDGTSVLGADNKAAIANVMTALEVLQEHPELEHGDLYVAFVPDEEVGLRGAKEIDFDQFPVDYAYTIDSCALGEIVYETFNAASAELRIRGISAHPMSSKNKLVNPVMVAVDYINLLNRAETPEHTEGREGYIWVAGVCADVQNCTVALHIRDHDKNAFEAKKAYLEEALKITKLRHPKAKIELEIHDVYGNIADAVTPENRKCIDHLYRALEELQIPAKTIAMRGGTDGSYISTRGILTPNYFTGAHNFHSRCEFWPMGSAEKSCLTTLKLIELAARGD